jgi:SAM-dependent methyltransferase
MSMRDRLYRFYWRLEKKIVPGHTSSQNVYYRELKAHLPASPVWLDLGCGHQMFPEWMTKEEAEMAGRSKQLVGIDLDHPSLLKHRGLRDKVEGTLEGLPFRDGVFDVVTANMVMEHVDEPGRVLEEIHRVLKPGGLFIFHTPNRLNFKIFAAAHVPRFLKNRLIGFFEGRKEEDVFRTYYRANTPGRVRSLSALAGFELPRLTLTDSSAVTIMLGPVVVLELLWFRICRLEALKNLRSNLIAVLRKPAAADATDPAGAKGGKRQPPPAS